MHRSEVASSWDDEYRSGRYVGEEPVPFVNDIVAAARRYRPDDDLGLYIGCGNGRNYVPLVDAGLDLLGIDVSSVAVEQLGRRRPDRRSRLLHGDVAALPEGAAFGVVIGIQVFQHGRQADAHAHIRGARTRLAAGGLLCIRVNAAGTQLEYPHTVTEQSETGGFTVSYGEGPKRGLQVHFFGRSELESLTRDLEPIVPLRRDRTYRRPPATGHWDQWEGIWRERPPDEHCESA